MDGDDGGWWWLLATVVTWRRSVVCDEGVCGRCSHLWPLVFVGGRGRSPCGRSLSVVVCVDGGGKQKRSHKQTLFVIHHKYITNK